VPIRLTDNTVVYSKGVGSAVFNPVMGGKVAKSVEFTQVLHVPELQNNLLAVLYLTRHRSTDVHISSLDHAMLFSINGERLFIAPINEDNTALLSGTTQVFTEHAHRTISTLPADRTLWHRHFSHHSHDVVNKIVNEKLVTGIHIDM